MPGYNAQRSLQPLSFDFSAAGGPKGTLPEPTPELVHRFDAALQGDSYDEQLTALAALCGEALSRDQLEQLPFRQFVGFVRWLHGELHGPRLVVRLVGVSPEKEQPMVDYTVTWLARPVVEELELEGEEEIVRLCARPLTKAFHEGAMWAQREILHELAEQGIEITVRTMHDEARDLLSQIDFGAEG